MDGMCRRGETNSEFWWGNLEERGHLEELAINSRIMIILYVYGLD